VIKLTKVTSDKKDAPSLIMIPGGPGLSSLTLRSMDILSRSFNLLYVDFPGTNGNLYKEDNSFDDLSIALKSELQKINGPKFVLGHSYGGFFAADLALKMKLDGIICISVPFSEKSLFAASENYSTKKSHALSLVEEEWEKLQDDKSLAKWLSEYGELYFIKEEGRDLLVNDKVSARFFLANRSDAIQKEFLLPLLKQNETRKLFIAGKLDGMLSEEILKEDAVNSGFNFISVNNASHFVTFDQPESVAGLIEDFMRQKQ
jgi:pimeloyl-ACP methyl ester carboxylesterase